MKIEKDFLIIGSGVAGLTFALKVADFGSVAIITKDELEESAPKYAQGGIASVMRLAPQQFTKWAWTGRWAAAAKTASKVSPCSLK